MDDNKNDDEAKRLVGEIGDQIVSDTLINLAKKRQAEEMAQLKIKLMTLGVDQNDEQSISETLDLYLKHQQELKNLQPKPRYPSPGKHSWEHG